MITNGACENIGQPRFPRRRGDLSVEELDGEAVLYDPRNGAVHRFNATTFYVWNACDGSHTPQDVAITIADRYAVEAEDALKIVGGVVAQLSERGLLQNDHMFAHGGIGLSRRELLGGGVTKAVLAAPVISTFFAAGAYASGPSASAAFGADGCKTTGYSCAVNADCCDDPAASDCEGGTCCITVGQAGCSSDDDCCAAAGSGCVGGTCTP